MTEQEAKEMLEKIADTMTEFRNIVADLKFDINNIRVDIDKLKKKDKNRILTL